MAVFDNSMMQKSFKCSNITLLCGQSKVHNCISAAFLFSAIEDAMQPYIDAALFLPIRKPVLVHLSPKSLSAFLGSVHLSQYLRSNEKSLRACCVVILPLTLTQVTVSLTAYLIYLSYFYQTICNLTDYTDTIDQ